MPDWWDENNLDPNDDGRMILTLPPVRALAFASSVAAFLANSAASLPHRTKIDYVDVKTGDNWETFEDGETSVIS